jgi:2-oxoglutarate ferredoxin oxidoreductase subunit delta
MMSQGRIDIHSARCKGCQLCAQVCPQGVIVMETTQLNAKGYHTARYDESLGTCTGCALCAVVCPDVCITVYRAAPQRRNKESAS